MTEPTLNEKRHAAAKKLMDANSALAGIISDAYAPVHCQNMIEVCEQRLAELKVLYSSRLFKD